MTTPSSRGFPLHTPSPSILCSNPSPSLGIPTEKGTKTSPEFAHPRIWENPAKRGRHAQSKALGIRFFPLLSPERYFGERRSTTGHVYRSSCKKKKRKATERGRNGLGISGGTRESRLLTPPPSSTTNAGALGKKRGGGKGEKTGKQQHHPTTKERRRMASRSMLSRLADKSPRTPLPVPFPPQKGARHEVLRQGHRHFPFLRFRSTAFPTPVLFLFFPSIP